MLKYTVEPRRPVGDKLEICKPKDAAVYTVFAQDFRYGATPTEDARPVADFLERGAAMSTMYGLRIITQRQAEPAPEMLIDVLTEVMHWAAANNVDFDSALNTARAHRAHEGHEFAAAVIEGAK